MARPTHRSLTTGEVVFPAGYDPSDLEPLPAGYWEEVDLQEGIAAIKAQAAASIFAVSPAWRQMNDLLAIVSGSEHPDFAAARARWDQIEEIRQQSNDQETVLTTKSERTRDGI